MVPSSSSIHSLWITCMCMQWIIKGGDYVFDDTGTRLPRGGKIIIGSFSTQKLENKFVWWNI